MKTLTFEELQQKSGGKFTNNPLKEAAKNPEKCCIGECERVELINTEQLNAMFCEGCKRILQY